MTAKKSTQISCKDTGTKGIIGLYIKVSGKEHFLFNQKFRHSVWKFYNKGVPYNMALDYSRAHNNKAIQNVMKRIRSGVHYLEIMENINIPEKRRIRKMEVCQYV